MMNVYYFHHQADELLGTASEQFLGKSVNEIKQTILQTLEGHLRAILGKSIHMYSYVCIHMYLNFYFFLFLLYVLLYFLCLVL